MAFTKTIVRGGVILALVAGGALVIAGPDRIGALMSQTHDSITAVIDDHIDDPVALRSQIKKLEAEYPARIAAVRSDLSEVQGQIAQLEREMQVATKVVSLTQADLGQLGDVIARGRTTQAEHPHAIVRVSYNTSKMNLDDAYAKRSRIVQTNALYADRAADIGTDLGYLQQQENQLAELLTRLETERSEFQSKLYQLDAQIDAIARNERMIGMMEARQETIDQHSRYQAHSLEQLNKRLTSIRTEQRGRLEAITGREQDRNYVEQAEFLIDRTTDAEAFAIPETDFTIEPEVIEVGPEDSTNNLDAVPVASRD